MNWIQVTWNKSWSEYSVYDGSEEWSYGVESIWQKKVVTPKDPNVTQRYIILLIISRESEGKNAVHAKQRGKFSLIS